MNPADAQAVLERFPACRVGVIGDFIADQYISGRPVRLSREAPIPILRHESTFVVPGGAANTVNNVCALGGTVLPLGVVGRDAMGDEVVRLLGDSGVDTAGIIRDETTETVTKTRLLAGDLHTVKQQIARIDRDGAFAPSPRGEDALLAALEKGASSMDILVVSDYGYRTLSSATVEKILHLSASLPVIVDSHERLPEFKGVRGAMPNESEAQALAGIPITDESQAREAGEKILAMLDLGFLLVTRGNQGMLLLEGGAEPTVIPISGSCDITDVSGAGDTVTALMALGLAAGAKAPTAARIANAAAGIVVMKRGTATVSAEELGGALA